MSSVLAIAKIAPILLIFIGALFLLKAIMFWMIIGMLIGLGLYVGIFVIGFVLLTLKDRKTRKLMFPNRR